MSAHKAKSKFSNLRPSTAPPLTLLSENIASEPASMIVRTSAKTTLADWTIESQDNAIDGSYGTEKRQRGGRKKRKKNKEEMHILQNWDDVYDPSRPNIYEDYKHSDERIMEIREWKDKLYAHRLSKRREVESESSDNDYIPHSTRMFPSSVLSLAANY